MQTIYLGLAFLMALALIGFGLGGAFGGSPLETLGKEGGSGSKSSYPAKIAAVEKRLKREPDSRAQWAELARLHVHNAASSSEYYDQEARAYTTKGKQQLRAAVAAWERYLQLESKHPSVRLAKTMLLVFGTEALNEPAKAVEALQIITAQPGEGSYSRYYELAYYAYLAHNFGLGNLAAKKTVSLTEKAKRPQIEVELERLKKEAESEAKASKTGGTSATTTGAATRSGGK